MKSIRRSTPRHPLLSAMALVVLLGLGNAWAAEQATQLPEVDSNVPAVAADQSAAASAPVDNQSADLGLVTSVPTANTDPCPLPEGVNTNGMADLAKIQEDIDRYTLCIQRAELLQQLAEAEQKNKDSFDDSLGLKDPKDPFANSGDASVVGDVAPPAAPSDVAPISESDLGGMGTAAAASGRSDWEIDSVAGGRTSLNAVLIAPDNTRMRVKVGSKLPNDAGTVVSVSPSDVTVSKGKKTRSLSWAQINAKSAAKSTDGL